MTPAELFEAHQDWASKVATNWAKRHRVACRLASLCSDDIRSVALAGLWDAAQRYDPARGVLFPAFAIRRIHGNILCEMRAMGPMGRDGRQRRPVALQVKYIYVRSTPAVQERTAAVQDAVRILLHALTLQARIVFKARLAGLKQCDIAQRLGVNPSYISEVLRKAHVELHAHARRYPEQAEQARELLGGHW